jgi:hypothetical protein
MKKAILIKLHGAMPQKLKDQKGKTGWVIRESGKEFFVSFTPPRQRRGGVRAWIRKDYLEILRPAAELESLLSKDPVLKAYQTARLKYQLEFYGFSLGSWITEKLFYDISQTLKQPQK